jgi:hypothetical protein
MLSFFGNPYKHPLKVGRKQQITEKLGEIVQALYPAFILTKKGQFFALLRLVQNRWAGHTPLGHWR